MNLSLFAPEDFKKHLTALENKAKFSKAGLHCELGATSNYQHYVLTGNEGVGKSDAVNEIYQQMVSVSGLTDCVTKDASTMFDFNDGFSSSMAQACQNNILLHIMNAEQLGMKANINPKSGLEELCSRMATMENSVVVLMLAVSSLVFSSLYTAIQSSPFNSISGRAWSYRRDSKLNYQFSCLSNKYRI